MRSSRKNIRQQSTELEVTTTRGERTWKEQRNEKVVVLVRFSEGQRDF